MEFMINSGVWGTMFGVPHVVADNFLKLATSDQLKVLLYILRYSGRTITDEEISRNTGVSLSDVADSVMFWQQVNVLGGQDYQNSSVQIPSQSNVSSEPVPEIENNNPSRQKQVLKPSEISDAVSVVILIFFIISISFLPFKLC